MESRSKTKLCDIGRDFGALLVDVKPAAELRDIGRYFGALLVDANCKRAAELRDIGRYFGALLAAVIKRAAKLRNIDLGRYSNSQSSSSIFCRPCPCSLAWV